MPEDRAAKGVTLIRVVSGGQTGVDRAALDAALEGGADVGGWCPADGMAEDGPIPSKYVLRPAPRGGYRERTVRNVLDSDGTLILYHSALAGGTEETLLLCLQLRRPYRCIDAREVTPERASEIGAEFIRSESIRVLNVAGPRGSQWPGGYDFAFRVVARLLEAHA